jgi:hypothetical protein
VTHILGKVVADQDQQSGPDVLLDIVVERDWLREARTIEIELPRHLSCAACQGAGCNICGQSGAITLRERSEIAEVVRVTLPRRDSTSVDMPDSTRALTLKVPGYGGLPPLDCEGATRGRLLIRINTSGPVSSCIRPIAVAAERTRGQIAAFVVPPQPTTTQELPQWPTAEREVVSTSLTDVRIGHEPVNFSRTARSVSPPPTARRARVSRSNAVTPRTPAAAVEPSIGWTWRDTLIGVALLILGAIAAWFFVSPR